MEEKTVRLLVDWLKEQCTNVGDSYEDLDCYTDEELKSLIKYGFLYERYDSEIPKVKFVRIN